MKIYLINIINNYVGVKIYIVEYDVLSYFI